MENNLNVIKYYGSKAVTGNRLKKHFDYNTKVYIEMFGGGASILLNKQKHSVEIYNELDIGVYTLFKVLKDEKSFHVLQKQLMNVVCEKSVFNESLYIREKYIKHPYDRVISGMDRFIKEIEEKYNYNLYEPYKLQGAGFEETARKIARIPINYKEYKNAENKMDDYNKTIGKYYPQKDVDSIKNETLYQIIN